jgi:cell surface protein SprA
LERKSNLGYIILLLIVLVAVIANTAARGYRPRFEFFPPEPDSTKKPDDSARKLRFPIYDRTGDPVTDYNNPKSIDLNDPQGAQRGFDFDPRTKQYNYSDRLGNEFLRNPTYLTLDEYSKYRAKADEDAYWQRRMDGLMLFNKKPELPTMYKEGLFDRIFGGNSIQVKPQGNVDVTFGGSWQNIKNPTLPQRSQKYGIFDFDMQMNINLLATVGDKLKLNISNNTKATFDYQNIQKLDYNGKEDEMLKKIEAGNVSFPLKSNLINGVQSLFGLKTQLQFGRLWVTAVLSQQKSQRKSLTIQGGAQSQQISIKASGYEENKNFLLAQYFRNNYNYALKDFPKLHSNVNISKIQVWITNRSGVVNGVRNVECFMDLGEAQPFNQSMYNPNSPVRGGLPDNNANYLYQQVTQNQFSRQQSSAVSTLAGMGLIQGQDFEATTARQLSPSEFSYNAQLGYIMLNTQMNPEDVLGVAFRYTYKGKVYQVGEFAEDLPPDTTNSKVIFLKLLKGTSARPILPVWDLMMKNVYALGGLGVSKDNFVLNILYQQPAGGDLRYIPDGPKKGIPLITLLNLDRLNAQNEPVPDGIFDFVEGTTINTQQGKIIFPVLEPFGSDLSASALGTPPDPQLYKKYVYQVLYDSTKVVAQQFQQVDRYIMRGSYKSSSSSDIFLGGFNIPPGSVSVSAGGTRLVENQDYTMDYSLGRIKILNTGILNSGVPINIQYEDNATFGFQQQNFMGSRLDYYLNKNLTLGGTFMRLTERPFTQQVSYGEDPIKNTVLGVDANYQTEVPSLTRALDKLPVYSTTAPSFLNSNVEVAALLPGQPRQIAALDPEGAVYIDNFEGTSSTYDLKFPSQAWSLAATPFGAIGINNRKLFPEAGLQNNLRVNDNRASLGWYYIEQTLIDGGGGSPAYVTKDPRQHFIRIVQQKDVFPNRGLTTYQTILSTFDLSYFPKNRGPYNFDATNIDNDGLLLRPEDRWAGITRPIDNTDFEASNVEYIQFWVMDPFVHDKSGTTKGGSLFFNLGNVSEDVLKDSRMFFENGVPSPFDRDKLDTTAFGYVPRFEQQITRAFDNDPTARQQQDIGYDGLLDSAVAPDQVDERTYFAGYLEKLRTRLGAGNPAYLAAYNDPATDNYHFFRGADYDAANNGDGLYIPNRYMKYNRPHGNSPITAPTASTTTSSTTIPESEDINRDNTLNQSESYFQYRIDFTPNMQVGTNYIISIQENPGGVKLPNGQTEPEKWYQFKIPVRNFSHRIGGIPDFRSIRFMRMFLSGWEDSTVLRFATLELGRNQWRTCIYNLNDPNENTPQQNQGLTDFTVTSVNIEENGRREPVNYVLPPGVNRQLTTASNAGQPGPIQMNEQSLSLRACALQEGDRRGVYKEVNVDMRQFTYLRTFIHAESMVGSPVIKDGDVSAFIRIGADFTNNYYEYVVPLTVTQPFANLDYQVWPANNQVNLLLQDLVNAKKQRDENGFTNTKPYSVRDSRGNTIVVVGNPNIGAAKNVMLGLYNPKKNNQTPGDDGMPKCVEVWFDEMRMAGIYDRAGYAAAGKVSVQMADLGNVNLSGSMHSPGYGNIDQKIDQRMQDKYTQYNVSTNLNLGKAVPKKWGVQLPFFAGYTQSASTPRYDPYNQDVELDDQLSNARNKAARDSIKNVAQDFTSIKSFNFTNVRIQGDPSVPATKTRKPWSIKNFDFSYSYNNQLKRNPTIEKDELKTQRYGLGYMYSIKTKPIEPFRRMIKSRSRWLSPIKDINITPLPSTFTMRNDLNRLTEEIKVRDFNDGSGYRIPPSFYKNFTWTRNYTLRWELMRSLSFDYNATNISRIDEPYGRIDSKQKRDSLWRQIGTFGRNNSYNQTFNSSYNVPLAKLPITDWMNCRLAYSATYAWTTAPPVAHELGNTIGNTNTKTVSGEFNMTQLYNKNRWLKALNSPRKKKRQPGSQVMKDKAPGSELGKSDTKRNEKDLRKQKGKDQDKSPGKDVADSKDSAGTRPGPAVSKSKSHAEKDTVKSRVPEKYSSMLQNVNTANMTDKQLDSLVKVLKAKEKEKIAAEKKKKKAERKAARKLRRSKVPELSTTEEIVGHILTMVNRVTVNYSQSAGTILPGYMDSTRFLGVNNYNGAPGFDFVYGYQPDAAWLARQASAERLSRDTFFNSQFQQNYSTNLNAQATVIPHRDLRIDLTLTKTFSKTHNELYADTNYRRGGDFYHLNPYEGGSFNISNVTMKTMFKNTAVNSPTYNEFLANRVVISRRLGFSNPYTKGVPDPLNPGYYKGYGPFSQDVLIPAFIAAYSGKNAESAALLDYKHDKVSDNPFRYYTPLPNWKVTYNGLSKLPLFQKVFSNFILNHTYTGTMSMNSFNSNLLFNDLYGLGFPSFLDSNSHNYIPFFQVPNVTMSQAFNPLIGIDVAFKSNVTAKFDIRKSKMQSLSLIDYQISENVSTEYVFGLGYRKKGIRLPFTVFGVKRLKNELICKMDVGIRDDKSSNTFLANNISVVSRGQKVIRISPTIDYSVSQKLTLHFYYDRQQTIPYVSNSYPSTTTRAGVTLRFLFAQ